MRINRRNLNHIRFENHNAKLLIQDIIVNSSATIFYYNIEITEKYAVRLWLHVRENVQKYSRMNLRNAS